MTNLKTIHEAVKQNIPLRIAEENLKIEQEQKEFKEPFAANFLHRPTLRIRTML